MDKLKVVLAGTDAGPVPVINSESWMTEGVAGVIKGEVKHPLTEFQEESKTISFSNPLLADKLCDHIGYSNEWISRDDLCWPERQNVHEDDAALTGRLVEEGRLIVLVDQCDVTVDVVEHIREAVETMDPGMRIVVIGGGDYDRSETIRKLAGLAVGLKIEDDDVLFGRPRLRDIPDPYPWCMPRLKIPHLQRGGYSPTVNPNRKKKRR